MGAGAPKGNKNAEKWTLEKGVELLQECVEISEDQELDCNDFIGEVAQAAGTTRQPLDYLGEKFEECKELLNRVKSNCEANCFRNAKKGSINSALGIINLKSNHGWTDRVDQTTKGEKTAPVIVNLGEGEKDG